MTFLKYFPEVSKRGSPNLRKLITSEKLMLALVSGTWPMFITLEDIQRGHDLLSHLLHTGGTGCHRISLYSASSM